DRLEPCAGHLEDAELADGAEPVLHGANHTVRMMPLALEVQHRVDHVLEHLGAGEAAVLRDVADEHRRNVQSLGSKQKLRGRLAPLADGARRRLELDREDGLDGIDHHECGLQPGDLFEDSLDTGLRQEIERRVPYTETIAAALDLMLRL